jgi:hypothetical protein
MMLSASERELSRILCLTEFLTTTTGRTAQGCNYFAASFLAIIGFATTSDHTTSPFSGWLYYRRFVS